MLAGRGEATPALCLTMLTQRPPADHAAAAVDADRLQALMARAELRPNAKLAGTLWEIYVRAAAFESAAAVVEKAVDRGVLRPAAADRLTSGTMKRMLPSPTRKVAERGGAVGPAWELLRTLEGAGQSATRHYTMLLRHCTGREDAQRLLRGMRRTGCDPDQLLWSELHAAFLSWSDVRAAAATLAEAAAEGSWSRREISATATSTLGSLFARSREYRRAAAPSAVDDWPQRTQVRKTPSWPRSWDNFGLS